VFLFISVIFTYAIAIFTLVAGSIKYWDESIGCNSKYIGVLYAWAAVDTYLVSVDQTLCSPECPCYMNTTTSLKYLSNTTATPYYSHWTKNTDNTSAIRFENCSATSKANVWNTYKNTNAYSNWTLDQDLFAQYWSNVERKFSCNGFCSTSYWNPKTKTNMKMLKYLFSDISA
jgi:hypothetical protein